MSRWMRGAAASAMLLVAAAPAPDAAPTLAITLAPAAPDSAGHIAAIDLTVVATGLKAGSGGRLLRLPVKANTVVTSADDITGLAVTDEHGALPLTTKDTQQDGSNSERIWSAARDIEGPVTIHYRVAINAARPPLVAPQYELRTEGGTVSGAANSFLLLPADNTARRLQVRWDLSHLGPGAVAASSSGVGDVAAGELLSAERISGTYYMAGKPGLYRAPGGDFFAVWQGNPAFPAPDLMRWAADLHHYYGTFFGYTPASFGVFARTNTGNPGSGIGLTDSFAFTFGPVSTVEQMKTLLAHEMLHAWVRSFDETMDAANGLDSSWFGEGLAVYYQRQLPWRAGLISSRAFLDDLNETAGRYYTNMLIATPNAEIAAGFWRDTRIRVLPYDRGSLFFASVDAAIRAHSGGQRSLDDLVRAMLAARRAGAPMNLAMWRRMLRAELGAPGVAAFDAMMAGKTVLPPSNAFGRCFRRTTKPLRRWDIGFDPASLNSPNRVVRGLIAGSNAAIAGLRDGDRITAPFPQDGPQGDQHAMLNLKVEREGTPLVIRYLPRGETVSSWQWDYSPGHSCRRNSREQPGSQSR